MCSMRRCLVVTSAVLAMASAPAGAERRVSRKPTKAVVDRGRQAATQPRAPSAPEPAAWHRKPKVGSYTRWPLPAAGHSHSGDPELIFTFDDGPSEKYTPVILDELKKRHIHAIFFLVGWRVTKDSEHRAKRRALVERMIREGHIVGNHTMTHPHLCHLPVKQAAAEIDDSHDALQELVHMPLVYFRTPYGDHCRKLVKLLDERGIDHLHWDIDPQEWKDHDAVRVTGTLRRKFGHLARDNRRAVVIMHDTHKATALAFPQAMKWLDRENARREAHGKPPVRILDGSDLARELMDAKIAGWVRQTGDSAADAVVGALASIVP